MGLLSVAAAADVLRGKDGARVDWLDELYCSATASPEACVPNSAAVLYERIDSLVACKINCKPSATMRVS